MSDRLLGEQRMIEKIPPQNLEAEQAVLGAMLLEYDAVVTAKELLRPSDFYRQAHQMLFRAIIAVHEQHEPVDLITVGSLLRDRQELDQVGGTLYMGTCMSNVPTASAIAYYAGLVRECADLRDLIRAADRIMLDCYAKDKDVAGILAGGEGALQAVRDRHSGGVDLEGGRVGTLMAEEFVRMVREHEHGAETGIRSSIGALNAQMGPGIQRGEVCVVAGATSQGKTTFAVQNIAVPAAKHGRSVLVLSLEMSQQSLVNRLMAANSISTALWQLRQPEYRKANWSAITDPERNRYEEEPIGEDMAQLINAADSWPLYTLYTPGLTPAELEAIGRKFQRLEKGCDLIVIDGLWIMESDKKTDSRAQEVSYLMRQVKRIAGVLNTRIVLVHQVNREGSDRPQLKHLRESGEVEQTADWVLFVHRSKATSTDPSEKAETELILAKARNDATGSVLCTFDGARNRFVEREEER